jgi:hypothetical protein
VKLTPQHLAEVVNAMNAGTATQAGAEKRRAARIDVQSSVVVAPVNADGSLAKPFSALTRNISFVGVGLLQSKPMTLGQQVIVRLPRGTKPAIFMRCAVMHVRPLADGLFVVGVEFVGEADVTDANFAAERIAADKLGPTAAAQAEVQRARQVILS